MEKRPDGSLGIWPFEIVTTGMAKSSLRRPSRWPPTIEMQPLLIRKKLERIGVKQKMPITIKDNIAQLVIASAEYMIDAVYPDDGADQQVLT